MTTSPATATATAAAAARAARGTPGLGVTAQAHAATIPHAGSHAWTAMVVTARVETSSGFPLVTRAHAKALVAAYHLLAVCARAAPAPIGADVPKVFRPAWEVLLAVLEDIDASAFRESR